METNSKFSAASAPIFALFVTPETRQRAVANLMQVLNDLDRSQYELSILDVFEAPEVADVAGIIATPTLVRYYPGPRLQIVGDLADIAKVRHLLFENNVLNDEVFLVHQADEDEAPDSVHHLPGSNVCSFLRDESRPRRDASEG